MPSSSLFYRFGLYKTLTTLIVFCFLTPLAYADKQNMVELYKLVENHVKQNIDQKLKDVQIRVRELPDTLELPTCQSNLEFNQNLTQNLHGRQTVLVSCPQPAWRIFVSVDVDGKLPVAISAKGIPRKAVINDSDVELKLVPLNEVRRGALESLESVIGMRAKRAIGPNQIITIQMLDAPYWVLKGQEVTIVSETSGIEITTKGTALENGMQQDQVSVENNASQIVVKGIVIAPNTVKVP
jgi:flagella basal body P-ring formation protein FlgA